MNNRDALIEAMTTYRLDRLDLASMLKVDRTTVDRWLLSRESAQALEVPDMAIELLRYKLQEIQPRDVDGPQ